MEPGEIGSQHCGGTGYTGYYFPKKILLPDEITDYYLKFVLLAKIVLFVKIIAKKWQIPKIYRHLIMMSYYAR